MFRQGDREKSLGQPVSPLMDRARGGVTKSQTGFFNIVARPIFTVSGLPPNMFTLVWRCGMIISTRVLQ